MPPSCYPVWPPLQRHQQPPRRQQSQQLVTQGGKIEQISGDALFHAHMSPVETSPRHRPRPIDKRPAERDLRGLQDLVPEILDQDSLRREDLNPSKARIGAREQRRRRAQRLPLVDLVGHE